MRDLNGYIVEQHAANWERLGLELGLKDYHIANISKDNEHNPNRSVTCCRVMLELWLRETPLPTWSRLSDAIKKINSLTAGSQSVVSSYSTGRLLKRNDLYFSLNIKQVYNQLRNLP